MCLNVQSNIQYYIYLHWKASFSSPPGGKIHAEPLSAVAVDVWSVVAEVDVTDVVTSSPVTSGKRLVTGGKVSPRYCVNRSASGVVFFISTDVSVVADDTLDIAVEGAAVSSLSGMLFPVVESTVAGTLAEMV